MIQYLTEEKKSSQIEWDQQYFSNKKKLGASVRAMKMKK